jgi:hypothetical protein
VQPQIRHGVFTPYPKSTIPESPAEFVRDGNNFAREPGTESREQALGRRLAAAEKREHGQPG